MARTVLRNNDEVAHSWAAQVAPRGEAGNFSFEGPKLYSYSTVIAEFVSSPKAGRIALYSREKYSNTTARHLSLARQALGGRQSFEVPYITSPEKIRKSFASDIKDAQVKAAGKHNKLNAARYWQKMIDEIEYANRFCDMFDLELFPVPESPDNLKEELRAEAERIEQERKKAESKQKRERAKKLKEAQVKIESWKSGADIHSYEFRDLLDGDLMRIIESGEIQTTRNAYVPVDDVRRFAPLILRLIEKGERYEPDRHILFGQFQLNYIDADGTVVVGCHRFKKEEVLRVAKLLDVTPEETQSHGSD